LPPSAEPPRGLGRALGGRLGAPHLVPISLALLAATAGWLLLREGGWARQRLRAAVTSPETQVKEALARQVKARLGDVYGYSAGGTIVLEPVAYGDVTVRVEGERAQVLAVVDASGEVTWRDGRARVAYVGREAFAMRPCSVAGWCADGAQFARLRAALATVFRRLDGARTGDLEVVARLVSERYEGGKAALLQRLRAEQATATGRRVAVTAWQVRVERDGAVVGEDYEVAEGDGPPRPLRARYTLAWEEGRWRFVAGL
jgi:hypothetical protein